MNNSWNRTVTLHEISRGPLQLTLEADEGQRSEIARRLDLQSLSLFRAELSVSPWLDGLELTGRFEAKVEQICGVSLDPFEQSVVGEIDVRIVPGGSHQAPQVNGDVELDADGLDAPDVMDGDAVDIAEYLVEHLSLELDPFPRKPGATFDPSPASESLSPFAALRKLTEPKA